MSVHDLHEFSKDGIKWNRVWQKPQMSIDTKLDAFSSKDYVRATNKQDSIGSLFDRSKEMSEKRKDKLGYDPKKQEYYNDYAKKRKGRRHMQERKDKLNEITKNPIELKIK